MNAPSKLNLSTHPSTTARTTSPAISALAEALSSAPASRRAAILEEFWSGPGAASPLLEPGADGTAVTFLWRDGDADAVLITINRVTNDLASSAMQRLEGTDLWHASYLLEDDWRGSYTVLALDADSLAEVEALEPRAAMAHIRQHGACDPRNPDVSFAHGGRRTSVAALAGAPRQADFDARPDRPLGETLEHRTPGGRRVWAYLPDTSSAGDAPRPVVVVLDGDMWHSSAYAATMADALADADLVAPPLVLMVDPGTAAQRAADLHIDGSMAEEIVGDILPWARVTYPVSNDPAHVVVTGESLGGLTALKVAFDHPDVVGCALGQSSSLWQHDMLERAATAAAPVRLFLTVGTKESVLLGPNRALRDALNGTDHRLTYVEFNGGHDMACWRGYWAEGLRDLLRREA